MNEQRIFKPGKQSLVITLVIVSTMLALGLAFLSLPDPRGQNQSLGCGCAGMAVLVGGLLFWVRSKSGVTLDRDGISYRRVGKEIRLPWDQVKGVRGVTLSGSKSDRQMVVLSVPELDRLIQENPKIKSFRFETGSEIGIFTRLYDEGAGEMVEAIKAQLQPKRKNEKRKVGRKAKTLQKYPKKSYRAWLAWGYVVVFITFIAMGVFIGLTAHGRISAYILSGVFLLFFLTLGGVSLAIALVQKVTLGEDFLAASTPGLTLKVSWEEVSGVERIGGSRSELILVKLFDYEAYLESLSEKARKGTISLLAGRGEGIPVTRSMMTISGKRLAQEIQKRAGLSS